MDADHWVDHVARDWRTAPLNTVDHALCALSESMVHRPTESTDALFAELREEGLDDRALHDAVQVIALFHYFTRIAEGLAIDLEPEELVRPWGSQDLEATVAPDPARAD